MGDYIFLTVNGGAMHATRAKWQAELVEQALRIAGATELSHELAGLELREKVDKSATKTTRTQS